MLNKKRECSANLNLTLAIGIFTMTKLYPTLSSFILDNYDSFTNTSIPYK